MSTFNTSLFYFGKPDQSKEILTRLEPRIKENKPGVYIIAGPAKVGKSKLKKELSNLFQGEVDSSFPVDSIDIFKMEKERLLKTIASGIKTFSFSETLITEEEVLRELGGVVRQHPDLSLILDIRSNQVNSWQNQEGKKITTEVLRKTFGDDVPYELLYLDADPERIIELLWENRNSSIGDHILNLVCSPQDKEIRQELKDYIQLFDDDNHEGTVDLIKKKFTAELRNKMGLKEDFSDPERRG